MLLKHRSTANGGSPTVSYSPSNFHANNNKEIELGRLLPHKRLFDRGYYDADSDDNDDDDDQSFDNDSHGSSNSIGRNCHYGLMDLLVTAILVVAIPTIIISSALVLFPAEPSALPSYPLLFTSPTSQVQIENFVNNGPAIILNIHITHHAGTTLCHVIGQAVGAPGRYCNVPSETDILPPGYAFPRRKPWSGPQATAHHIAQVRQAYRFVSWEFGSLPRLPLNVTDWEHPHLISLMVIRHPLSRLLAADAYTAQHYPFVLSYSKQGGEGTAQQSKDDWWKFAKDPYYDNFALRRLVGATNTTTMTRDHFLAGQQLLERFTFVLDQACLPDNLRAVGNVLNITMDDDRRKKDGRNLMANPKLLSLKERFPFEDIYHFVCNKFQYDIQLYEWARPKSLVQCLREPAM